MLGLKVEKRDGFVDGDGTVIGAVRSVLMLDSGVDQRLNRWNGYRKDSVVCLDWLLSFALSAQECGVCHGFGMNSAATILADADVGCCAWVVIVRLCLCICIHVYEFRRLRSFMIDVIMLILYGAGIISRGVLLSLFLMVVSALLDSIR